MICRYHVHSLYGFIAYPVSISIPRLLPFQTRPRFDPAIINDEKLENIEHFHSSTPQEEEFEFSSMLHPLINRCIIKSIGFISIPGNYTTFQFYDKKLENIEDFHSSTARREIRILEEFSSMLLPLINRRIIESVEFTATTIYFNF